MNEKEIMTLQSKAKQIRHKVIEMGYRSKKIIHYGASLSEVEILLSIYQVMKQGTRLNEEDFFILSKGHGALGYYAVLGALGYMNEEEMALILQNGSPFQCLITKNEEKGFMTSNGSLGHGLSFAIGKLLSARYKKQERRAFVLLGDGESQEGSVWEGIMFAAQHQLNNLIVIMDKNNLQIDGKTEEIIGVTDPERVFEGFGWNFYSVDGHDMGTLIKTLESIPQNNKPTIILAETIKGKGVDFMEGNSLWHQGTLTEKQYLECLEQIERGGTNG